MTPQIVRSSAAKIAGIAAIACAGAVPLSATTILVLATNSEAWLVADSLRSIPEESRTRTVCKIIATGKAAYTIAGVSAVGGQDVQRLIAAFATDDVEATFAALDTPIKTLLSGVRLSEERRAHYLDKPPAISAVVAIGLAPSPVKRRLAFYLRSTGIESKPAPLTDGISVLSNALEKVQEVGRAELAKPSPSLPNFLDQMMQAASAADPSTAPPFSMVRLSSNGVEWILRGACAVK